MVDKQDNKIQGIWWFSDNPENQVSGELFIEERKLELNGSLEGFKSLLTIGSSSKFVSIQKEKFILGVSRKGNKKYTLEFYDQPASIIMSMPGYQSDTYSLGNIFEGAYIDSLKNGFSKYYVEMPHIFEWINNSIITSTINFQADKTIKEVVVKIGSILQIEIFKNTDFKIIYIIRPDKFPLSISQETLISQKCYLQIESLNKNLPLDEFYSIIFHLTRFLSIAVGQALEPTSIQASADGSIDIIEVFPHFYKEISYPKIHPSEMNFVFSELDINLQNILEKWFSQKEKYSDVFDLFSSINTGKNKNLNNQFNDIISAIEGYVRIEKNQLDLKLDKTIKTLNEALPEANRPLVKSDYDKIRVTRNKISHIALKPGDEVSILSNQEKYICLQKMKFLLEYSFLKNIGLEESLLNKFYLNKKRLF